MLLDRNSIILAVLATACTATLPSQLFADESPPLAPSHIESVPAEPETSPQRWMTGFHSTYIWQRKPTMAASYTLPGSNSLQQGAETGYTLSATLYLGARPWKNTEFFVNPEIIQSTNISNLHGLGGPSNGEAQKGGGPTPSLYLARAFVRQTFVLGGESVVVESGPHQFAHVVSRRRLVVTLGNLSLLDVFDANGLAHDARTQFMNWALLTHGSFDYAADSRGYTWGFAVEYDHDDWAFRAGRFATPKQSNGLALDFKLLSHYGDSIEIEHHHEVLGRPGSVRLLGFRNRERMGGFAEALAYSEANGGAPSVDNVRRDRAKSGLALAIDQTVSQDASIFVRGSFNDGQTETYSFTEIERSVAVGTSTRGTAWCRRDDVFGAAWVINGLSSQHREYLRAGGLGFFIGDGQLLRYRSEQLLEVYYSAPILRGLWASLDFQHIANPAYNADRGPVNFIGVRMHLQL